MNIQINLANGFYDIIVEEGIISKLNKYIPQGKKTLIVTDDGVPSCYAKTIADSFVNSHIYTIKQGEQSKNLQNYQAILSFMLKNNFTRQDIVIACGGGVVGDLSGFVASTYMRGIPFYNVPTTFLSMVDSSIGGKVAVDFDGVKNSVGAFYQPKGVFIDTNLLTTLSDRQLYSGLCESIKMSATCDANLFGFIESVSDIRKNAKEIIERSLLIKKNIVQLDEKEADLRKVLNFGHTIGHAIESYYEGSLYHGECVGLGMLFFSSNSVRDRIKNLLLKYNLPVSCKADVSKLITFIEHDKKATAQGVTAVKVNTLGQFEFENLSIANVQKILENII